MSRDGARQVRGEPPVTLMRWLATVLFLVLSGQALYVGLSEGTWWKITLAALWVMAAVAFLVDTVRRWRRGADLPDA